MQPQFNVKSAVFVALQWFGAVVAFIVGSLVANAILPLPQAILDAVPAAGVFSGPVAMLFSAAVIATILLWAARRSSFSGLGMWLQLLVLSFGAETFQTQIETGYFITAFPLLQGNFVVYLLILRGLVKSIVFVLLLFLLVGGFSRKSRPEARFRVTVDRAVKAASWLAAVYVVLYLLFGYYIAWQSQELRLFYGGPTQLNSLTNQWLATLMNMPELPVFQYFRGVLWLLCLIPLFKGFSGRRLELVILSALALAYLPTVELSYPNPLMPAAVSIMHFWEVSISMAIFGALCAWFVPRRIQQEPTM
jgi:hypothetical protein